MRGTGPRRTATEDDPSLERNLRVGGASGARLATGIPIGSYPVKINDKQFNLNVADDNGNVMAICIRVA